MLLSRNCSDSNRPDRVLSNDRHALSNELSRLDNNELIRSHARFSS